MSGRAEFASIAVTTLANAAAEGVKAKMVVTGNFDFPGHDPEHARIKSVKDLEGKRMGATAIGSMEYTIARSYLKKQGVDLAKIDWVATRQTSNTIQAMAAGQIDAAWIVMSSAVTAIQLHPQPQDPGGCRNACEDQSQPRRRGRRHRPLCGAEWPDHRGHGGAR